MSTKRKMLSLTEGAKRIFAAMENECELKESPDSNRATTEDIIDMYLALKNDLALARIVEVDYLIVPAFDASTGLNAKYFRFSTLDGSLISVDAKCE